MARSRIRFVETPDRVLSLLEVHTVDRPDLVPALTKTLLSMRVQLVRFETQIVESAVHARLSVVEFDGARIAGPRRLEIQAAVLSAIDAGGPRPLARGSLSRSSHAMGRALASGS